jgi:DsbC/DsbD-like thiol-disulfide interchange protein
MKRPFLISPILVFTCVASAPAEVPDGAEAKAVGISLALLTDVAEVVPGRPFLAGVRMVTEPGYHTYWKAPGIVGFATAIEWVLPEGFTVGELRWPAPETVMMLEYKSRGYAEEALLFAEITPPETISGDQPVALAAKVSWMACERGCHPGHLGLRVELPVGDPASGGAVESPSRELFAAAAAAVPKDLALGGLGAVFDGGVLRIAFELPPETAAAELSFIPEVSLHDPNVPQQVAADANGNVVISLPVMEHALGSVPEVLSGLLHRPDGWPTLGGDRFGRVSVTVKRVDD